MILVYLQKSKLVFLENTYSEKGKRLGTLIEEPSAGWCFWPERATVGLPLAWLLQIAVEITRLNARSLPSPVAHNPFELTSGHTVPESSLDAPQDDL